MTGGASPPPKDCPICGASIWPGGMARPASWKQYRDHLRSNHQQFARWEWRTFLAYYLAVIPFFGFSIMGSVLAPSADGFRIYAGLAFGSALAVVIVIRLFRDRAKSRFHELWSLEHDGPINPH